MGGIVNIACGILTITFMEQKKIRSLYNILTILSVSAGFLVFLDVLLVVFVATQKNTVALLKTQLIQLEQDYRVLSSSENVVEEYRDETEILSNVFPTEGTMLEFIQTLETLLRNSSEEYSIKFNSLTPVVEQDKLFLLLTLTLKTDLIRLDNFLGALEKAPFMTHVTGIVGKMPDSFNGTGELTVGLKVYVNNPFQSR